MSARAAVDKAASAMAGLRPAAKAPALLQRKCACGRQTYGAGVCDRCAKDNGAPAGRHGPGLQAKLSIGASDDPLEHEADRVAAMVLGEGGHAAATGSAVRLQRSSGTQAQSDAVPASVEHALAGAGRPLDEPLRQDMEQRFGHDFSGVRVHAGTAAQQSARDVQAHAYTVGRDIVFGAGQFAPGTTAGRRLLAHELAHVVQQGGTTALLQRVPAPPVANGKTARHDPAKVRIGAIPDVLALPTATTKEGEISTPRTVTVKFSDPAVTHLAWELYDAADTMVAGYGTVDGKPDALGPFIVQNTDPGTTRWKATQGKYVLRCVGYNSANEPLAYADRNFYIWTSTPTADYAGLLAQSAKLGATTKAGSGKSFGEVGSAFAKLKDVSHDISLLETGKGIYEGNQCSVPTAGAIPTDCTNILLEVLGNTFAQQGRAADWDKVQKKYAKNIGLRGGKGLSGIDIQAALQSECGWKGIYWAPDPNYQVPKAELSGATSSEAAATKKTASKEGPYYKDYYIGKPKKKGFPGVTIDHLVTDYAPEAPNTGFGTASKTKKETGQLDKLRKLPFGILSAHGGYHMTIITYGKVIEVHWSANAKSMDVIEETDLATWAVGPNSGFHYYASGAIVAPADDVDKAFKP
jgi:hypothetical protein